MIFLAYALILVRGSQSYRARLQVERLKEETGLIAVK
jgi:hypothetical protein